MFSNNKQMLKIKIKTFRDLENMAVSVACKNYHVFAVACVIFLISQMVCVTHDNILVDKKKI